MYGGSRQSLWIIQPKAMEVSENDRRQTMIFILIYIQTILGYTTPICTGKLNKEGEMTEEVGVAQKEIRYKTNVIF